MNYRFYTVEDWESIQECQNRQVHERVSFLQKYFIWEPTNSSSFVFHATSSFHSHLKTRVEPQLGFYLALYDKNSHQHLPFHLPKLNVILVEVPTSDIKKTPQISHLPRLLSLFQKSYRILIGILIGTDTILLILIEYPSDLSCLLRSPFLLFVCYCYHLAQP